MIQIPVHYTDIEKAKDQIDTYEKSSYGEWRYSGVEAWKGIVCEILCGDWLRSKYGSDMDPDGLVLRDYYDPCDMIINGKKVEIKSATKNAYRYVMPKVKCVIDRPKDIFVACKYNETTDPDTVEIWGWMSGDDVLGYPIKQNKGAKYFEVPLNKFNSFE